MVWSLDDAVCSGDVGLIEVVEQFFQVVGYFTVGHIIPKVCHTDRDIGYGWERKIVIVLCGIGIV